MLQVSNTHISLVAIGLFSNKYTAGTGKTSLLRSMVQTSDDIVHVDPFPQNSIPNRISNAGRVTSRIGSKRRRPRHHASAVEIYASTRPYPEWWTDLEDSRVLRRRKSQGDVVLERNICFVDTVDGKSNRTDQTELEVRYMKQQFQRAVTSIHTVDSDLRGLLSGNGGSQVDSVLYLISEGKLL